MNNLWKLGNGIRKLAVGVSGKQSVFGNFTKCPRISAYTRAMQHMPQQSTIVSNKAPMRESINKQCRCGCGRLYHTEGDRSMVEFLNSEIKEERKSQKMSSLPQSLGDFSIQTNGAEMKFEKKNQNETITLSFSVNDSVDTQELEDEEHDNENEMKSRPCFDIEIARKNTVLRFSCSYVQYLEDDDKDVFQIDEVSLYEGERNDKNYSVAADILDDKLYDLFIQLLFEKGITNDFMDQVSEVATYYEHSKYINLLEGLHKFSSAN